MAKEILKEEKLKTSNEINQKNTEKKFDRCIMTSTTK